ncbi:TPA: hypothetical protein JAN03_18475 [Citrobacter freundii]|nr:hypothetical protein [Citrobacter freundii]
MFPGFIKKEGMALTILTRYLLGEQCGNRLKTIDELAGICSISVGLTQTTLKILESSGAIRLERRGCKTTLIHCYRRILQCPQATWL